jgi:hypothetical protein
MNSNKLHNAPDVLDQAKRVAKAALNTLLQSTPHACPPDCKALLQFD